LKGIVHVGAVNCDEEQELCGNFGVKGFPTIKVFPSKLTPVSGKKDAFHKVPEDYNGARSASGIVNYALSKLPSFVVPVSSKTEEKFLGQELPKAILFTNKDKTSDLYKGLSIDFHNRMVLGEAKHSDTKLVEKYGVTTFPTLLVIKGEEHVKFDGKLSHETLTKFLEPHAIPAETKPSSSSSKSSKEKEKEPEPAPQETGEIFEVKDQASFDAHCGSKPGLCAIAFLDRENFDQAEWDKYVALLKTLGEKYKNKLRIVYLDGPSQPELTRALDLSAFYPGLVVLNPQKLKYAVFKGAFTEEAITEYFGTVLGGSRRTLSLDKLPAIATEQPKQPRVPVPEEELDLEEPAQPAQKLKDEI
jgi:protein disulfide-isomerase A6